MRFTGFTDEWNSTPLNQMVERVTRKNKNEESNIALTISAQYGLVDQESFFNNKVASSDLSHYYLLYKGDYAYNKSYSSGYPWGAVKRLNMYEKGAVSTLYICFRPLDTVDSDFIGHYFESSKWHKGVSEIAVEGARNHGLLNIGVKDFFNTVHFMPSLAEQKKIASLLSLIDERIATQNKIIEDLKKLKSAIIDHIMNNSNYHRIRFEELYNKAGEGGTPSTSVSEYYTDGTIPFVKIEDLSKKYLFDSKDHITELGLCKSSAWIIPTNSIIYSNGATIGAISINKIPVCTKQGILGIIPKKEFDVEYLYYFMSSTYFRRQVERIVTEGTMRTAYLKDINHIECAIPDLEKQYSTSQILRSISNKIDTEQTLITAYVQHKDCLLKSMFI